MADPYKWDRRLETALAVTILVAVWVWILGRVGVIPS